MPTTFLRRVVPQPPAPSSVQKTPEFQQTIALSPEADDTAACRPELPFAKGLVPSVSPMKPSSTAYGGAFLPFDPPSFEPPRLVPVPPPIPSRIAPPLGLRAVSDAAAAVTDTPSNVPAQGDEKGTAPEKVVDLLWFDPRSMARIRKQPAWRAILEELADEPIDPEIDDPELHVDPATAEERREVFEVLMKGEPTSNDALRDAFKGAVRRDGRFVAPLVLLEGEMSLPYDEIATLEATVAVVGPLAAADEGLKAALVAGKEFLSARGSLSSHAAAAKLGVAIKLAYEQGKRVVSIDDVVAHIEQALLDERRYQRRAVLGGKKLRGLLQLEGASEPIPAYLPESLADVVPMFPRFGVRLIAETVMAADSREKHAMALRVVAVARIGMVEGW